MSKFYNLITDFGSNVKIGQLLNEIQDAQNIAKDAIGIKLYNNTVECVFSEELDQGESDALDVVVANHTPATENPIIIKNNIELTSNKYTTSSYSRISTFVIKGDQYNIESIKFVGEKNSNVTSYDVRIIDIENNNIIASGNYTNDNIEINDMGTISNSPTTEKILEAHVKKNGGSRVYIYEMFMFLREK